MVGLGISGSHQLRRAAFKGSGDELFTHGLTGLFNGRVFRNLWDGPGPKKNSEEGSDEGSGYITNITSWWLSFNPFEKDAQVKLDHFPKFSG